MTFDELLITRRSIRKYRDEPVPLDVIEGLLRSSQFAPSAGNEQPWKYVVVTNQDMMRRISEESKKNILARIDANPDDYANKYRPMLQNEAFNVFHNAPCLVLILGPGYLRNIYVDCALAASYLMMAATAKGLGTCWVNLGREIADPGLRSSLKIPEDAVIVAPIILGYPIRVPDAPTRKEPEIIHVVE